MVNRRELIASFGLAIGIATNTASPIFANVEKNTIISSITADANDQDLLSPVFFWIPQVTTALARVESRFPSNLDRNSAIRRILLIMLSESKGDKFAHSQEGAEGLLGVFPQNALRYAYLSEQIRDQYQPQAEALLNSSELWTKSGQQKARDILDGSNLTQLTSFWLESGIWVYLNLYQKYDGVLMRHYPNLSEIDHDRAVHRLAMIAYAAGDQYANKNIRQATKTNPRYRLNPNDYIEATALWGVRVANWDTDTDSLQRYLLLANGELERVALLQRNFSHRAKQRNDFY